MSDAGIIRVPSSGPPWTPSLMAKAKAMVVRIAGALIPGWSLDIVFADSMQDTGGALAYCIPQPRREQAKIVIAPHPPDERLEETIAHELGHAWVSPLVELIEPSEAAITIEEVLIERFSKFAASHPGLVGALARVTRNPRTNSAIMRQRISALAPGRLGKGKRRMMTAEQAQKALDALVAGDSEAAMAVLKEMIAGAMSGGDEGPKSAPMREEDPAKPDPQMREDEVPEAMRTQYRTMARVASSSFESMKRLAIHELRTVDKLDLTPAIESRLRKARTPEDFEERVSLVRETLGSGETRKRSGVKPDASDVNGAPSLDSMTADGIPEPVAQHVRAEYARGKAHGEAAMKAAARFRKKVTHG